MHLHGWGSVSVRAHAVLQGCETVTLCAWPWVTLPPPPQPPTAQAHTDSLNTLVALHQLYQYTQKYYDEVGAVSPGRGHLGSPSRACLPPDVTLPQIISALEEDPAAQKMQLAFRLQQIAAALENKVTDL